MSPERDRPSKALSGGALAREILTPARTPTCSEVLGGPKGGTAGTALLMPFRVPGES